MFTLPWAPHHRGTIIRHNFFHHIGQTPGRQAAVYTDIGSQDITVEGNIFYRMTGAPLEGGSSPDQYGFKAGIMNNGCNYVRVINNMFIDCEIPYRKSYWLTTWGKTWEGMTNLESLTQWRDRRFAEYNFAEMAHGQKYPALLELEHRDPIEAWVYPAENTFKKNLVYNPAIPLNEDSRNQLPSPDDPQKRDLIRDTKRSTKVAFNQLIRV